MFIPLLIYILIGIMWNIKYFKLTMKGFKIAIEKYNEEPSIGEILFTLLLMIFFWAPIEVYARIKNKIAKKNDKESK